ncbi:hypothetical protein KRE40_12140 [Elizabethkingia meningoseptica]|uniref:Uncharacterized protein n=1 Tax=Elizabethkingia meningoseptica TaxID=238 RepID=A0A1V3U4R5_ELIME|nr:MULTISPECIES: hypothetical protein [Elizabethkingia]AQX03839.1 hypothetical protein BBD33_00615 [Elizabethkingia meningoseptica]AQX11301.1 hypothetical protein BBD35_02420 [Elizabethkingia meningoseptica]AQX45878.1 hypothetical protein B5G46_00615 [Elizabethkingia meningoseptica]EJK5329805.1 hypothetical protein [Elizabethkingia meningoseptica]EOR28707.1 hypothetical protein L100_15022 [Elizabethkingia meningoseptica ATCC 13253 = NBRC 12535]
MPKKRSNTNNISDNLGNNQKKTDLERAKIALEKAKEASKNRPVIRLSGKDNEFGRALSEKITQNKTPDKSKKNK